MQITPDNLPRAINELINIEPAFAEVIERYGMPPQWGRAEGFPTLIQIILEQQVSLASGKAAFGRLAKSSGEVTPERFLEFTDEELKAIGFSRQKTYYGRNVSNAILDGALLLEGFAALDDQTVRTSLTSIKGIGIWTANIYLLMAMQRADVWPNGDIALAAAFQQLTGLDSRPTNEAMELISSDWAPWRSIAARLLWHFYLSNKGRQA